MFKKKKEYNNYDDILKYFDSFTWFKEDGSSDQVKLIDAFRGEEFNGGIVRTNEGLNAFKIPSNIELSDSVDMINESLNHYHELTKIDIEDSELDYDEIFKGL